MSIKAENHPPNPFLISDKERTWFHFKKNKHHRKNFHASLAATRILPEKHWQSLATLLLLQTVIIQQQILHISEI